jgi:hypothetical protein
VNASDIRAEEFTAFQELSEVIPEMRAGQLIAAVGELCTDLHGRGLWDADNSELLEAVWQFRRNYEAAVAGSRNDACPCAPECTGREGAAAEGGSKGSPCAPECTGREGAAEGGSKG